ncbi:ABC transporter permease [Salipiger aestuarii]|uniref:Iron complex transport system permease protein n=1 Tax=Salipiger aestuarii TaxID=568098 RepID=A0A327XTW4_9RHOB|nr:transport system permease protein [Citreicella sp. 357]KAA8605301.1 ABC transporter permease [Salipiger aestuarii]KAA8607606.1 ABC transporter permease [Salipiger aestuarii]KAB2538444.1 ABC transporter permease [Salipiger aestuarii]RAK09439.1 iron complex transport system permease protein [Salipiger aestuarii]
MRPLPLATALGALVIALLAASLSIGYAPIPLGALFGAGDALHVMVMQQIRLPRSALAALVGAALGLSGAAMQGYLRNPLAEPGLIGVSGSAALGAVIALQTGLAGVYGMALPLMALLFAAGAVGLILLLAGPRGGSLTLILAGIAVSALAGALTSLTLNLSSNPYATFEIVFWMMGSVADRSLDHLALAAPLVAVGSAALLTTGRGLDALTLGEDAAEALGISLIRLRLSLLLGTAAAVGAATAVAGAVGFVGLVVPHLLRPVCGARPSRLLWASALGGAAMVLSADIAVRLILPDRDLKLGVVMAILGAPLFLHLIYRTRRAA